MAGPAIKKRKTTDNEQCGDAKASVTNMTGLEEASGTDDPSPNGEAGPVNKKRKTTENEQRGSAKAPVADMTGLGKASATNNHGSLFGNPEISDLQASNLSDEHLDNHLPPSGTGEEPGSLPPQTGPGRLFRIPTNPASKKRKKPHTCQSTTSLSILYTSINSK